MIKNYKDSATISKEIARKLDNATLNTLQEISRLEGLAEGQSCYSIAEDFVSTVINDYMLGWIENNEAYESNKTRTDIEIPMCTLFESDKDHEYADSMVDIYYYSIYKSTPIFANYVSEAMDEGLLEGVTELDKLIQGGQYKFYNDFYNEVYQLTQEL